MKARQGTIPRLTQRRGGVAAGTLAAVIAALPGLAPGLAGAQALEEIIVTARKRAESIQEVPIAISSFSGEDLAASGAADLSGVSLHTPNLMFTTSASSDSTLKVAIRGQAQNDNIGTLDQSVGVYVDDVIWARPVGVNMNLADIERVEVLRGPQGTLFGRNTTGGAIQVYTRNPEFFREARVAASVGNYERGDYSLMVNTPLIDDVLALRLSYDAQKRDGWQDNRVFGYDAGQKDNTNLIAKLLYKPNDSLDLLLKLDRSEGDYLTRGQVMTYFDGGAPAFGGADPVAVFSGGAESAHDYVSDDYDRPREGFKPRSAWKHQGAGLTANWAAAEDLAVKAVVAYRELDEQSFGDYDGTPYPILDIFIGQEGHRMMSGEINVNGASLDDRLEWTLGAYYFKEEGGDRAWVAFGLPIRQAQFGDTENTSKAVFGQLNYLFGEQLTATLGLRYSEEGKDLLSRNHGADAQTGAFLLCSIPTLYTGVADPTDKAGCEATFSRDDDSVDYVAMLAWQLADGKMVYAKTGSGFRSGGQNLRGGDPFGRDSAGAIASFASFAPEEVVEYELGFKGDFLDARLRTNIALFHSIYEDIQRSTIVPVGGVATLVSNAAEGEVRGIEAEVQGVLSERWDLGATVGWTDAEYDKFQDFDFQGNPVDRSSEPFIATPEYSWSAWTEYRVPMATGELSLRLDYAWLDEHVTFASTRLEGSDTPAKGLFNGRIQWDLSDAVSLGLWGKNLTDERYREYGIELLSSNGY
ncbi:MAG: TonB-dependent receptor, partial [Trueperaceae bacterium]